jgi:hypothetical protein
MNKKASHSKGMEGPLFISASFAVLVMIFPVTLGVPLMVVSVPSSMVRIPATFALGVQIAPAIVCIKFCFPFFDFMLAPCMVVGVQLGYGDQRGRA